MAADAACAAPCAAWAEPAPDAPDVPDFEDAPEFAEGREVPGAPEVPEVPDVLDVLDDPRPCVAGRAAGRPEPPPAFPDPGVRPLPVALERAAAGLLPEPEPDADGSSDGRVPRDEELVSTERGPLVSEPEAAGEAGLAGLGAAEGARPLDAGAAGTGSEGSPST